MRILFVSHGLGAGGAERVLTLIANRWANAGCDVQIATYESQMPFFPLDGRITRLPLDLAGRAKTRWAGLRNTWHRIRALRRAIQDGRPDVVISFQDKVNIETLLAAKKLSVPVIVSERCDPALNPIGSRLRSWLRDRTYRRAARLVVQTQRALDFFAPAIQARATIIPNPVVPPANDHGPGEFALARPAIVAVGRLVPQKGFNILLEAWSRIADRHLNWSLTVLGDGPLRVQLESQRQALRLNGRVHFSGVVKSIGSVLRQADLFVLPSLFEGFPNALCEAMACGLPVISTDCPSGPREIIRDGVDGLLVPPNDPGALAAAMDRLIADHRLRARLADQATGIVERFSLEAIAAAWTAVVEQATGKSTRSLAVQPRRAPTAAMITG